MNISGKTVLITGAARRIGKAIALAFARSGCRVVVHYNRSENEARQTLEELKAINAENHQLLRRDLSDLSSLEDVFKESGKVDVLVNNASVFHLTPLAEESEEDAISQFDINVRGPKLLMKIFHDQHLPAGCVVNLLDQRVVKTSPNGGSYPLSKKMLAELTKQAALQWAPRLRVNGIAPGPVLPPVGKENSQMKLELENVPLARKVDLDDLTESCLFLVRNESITGQILFVDCGQHLS